MPPVDITFTVKASVANGRRLMKNDDGSTFWEGDEPTPKVDLIAARNADVDAAFDVEEKRLLKEALGPVNPAPKSRAKKRLIHG